MKPHMQLRFVTVALLYGVITPQPAHAGPVKNNADVTNASPSPKSQSAVETVPNKLPAKFENPSIYYTKATLDGSFETSLSYDSEERDLQEREASRRDLFHNWIHPNDTKFAFEGYCFSVNLGPIPLDMDPMETPQHKYLDRERYTRVELMNGPLTGLFWNEAQGFGYHFQKYSNMELFAKASDNSFSVQLTVTGDNLYIPIITPIISDIPNLFSRNNN